MEKLIPKAKRKQYIGVNNHRGHFEGVRIEVVRIVGSNVTYIDLGDHLVNHMHIDCLRENFKEIGHGGLIYGKFSENK